MQLSFAGYFGERVLIRWIPIWSDWFADGYRTLRPRFRPT